MLSNGRQVWIYRIEIELKNVCNSVNGAKREENSSQIQLIFNCFEFRTKHGADLRQFIQMQVIQMEILKNVAPLFQSTFNMHSIHIANDLRLSTVWEKWKMENGMGKTDEHLIEPNKNRCFFHIVQWFASHCVECWHLHIFDGISHCISLYWFQNVHCLGLVQPNDKSKRYWRDNFNSNDNNTTNDQSNSIRVLLLFFSVSSFWFITSLANAIDANWISICFLFYMPFGSI